MAYDKLLRNINNIVFLGEAGCGKSEIALNCAVWLSHNSPLPVRFFDLDQTKPIFRSRDAKALLNEADISLFHAEHFFDSPTIVGGVAEAISNPGVHAVLDIGGDETGARIIGRFAKLLNMEHTAVYYVVNPYRPWSQRVEAVDHTLSSILHVTRVKKVHVLLNPNLGASTIAGDVIEGYNRAVDMLGPYVGIEGLCAREGLDIQDELAADIPIIPLKLYLKYEWL